MASITHIDVEVRPSIGFQTIGYTARIQFDAPIDAIEALDKAGAVRDLLTEQAHKDLDALVAYRQKSEGEAKAQSPAPAYTPTALSGGVEWATGNKPNGKGTFRYVTSNSLGYREFKDAAIAQLAGLGLNPDDVEVFDDRTGKYGLESGNEVYSPGKLKVKDGTTLASALPDGKSIVGSVDFNNDGSVRVSLSRDAKAALQALSIAANLRTLDATPI
jgi:hypothetical protein